MPLERLLSVAQTLSHAVQVFVVHTPPALLTRFLAACAFVGKRLHKNV